MVVTRIAPSPTGRMHIGTARTALFNYLWAKHEGGKFIVRIEDTDPARDKPEYEKDILDNLHWLGIQEDEFHRQSGNNSKHEAAIRKLIDAGNAYVSREPGKDDPTKEVEVVRFKNPNKSIVFRDELRGDITVHSADVGDFVIARSLTSPIHHLAVVVDDAEQGVTLAMRGEDLLSNTPRQILIQDALGIPRPKYLHLPLILAPDRTKLSKRKHATSIGDFRDKGYLAPALSNFLAFLGWNPGTEQEIFSMDELVAAFSIPQIQKNAAIFNEEKLKWMNREHMLRLTPGTFWESARGYLSPETVSGIEEKGMKDVLIPLMRERIQILNELREMDEKGEWGYFMQEPEYPPGKLVPKGEGPAGTKARLEAVLGLLRPISGSNWAPHTVKEAVWGYAEKEGKGAVLWPLRFALSGKEKSPDPFTIAGIIGKDETIKRIARAVEMFSS